MASVYETENYSGRVSLAARYIAEGRESTRAFDTCFEMYDGSAVAVALYQRAQKDPQGSLARRIWEYLGRAEVEQLAANNAHRSNLAEWAQELRAEGQRKSDAFLAKIAAQNAERCDTEETPEGVQALVPGVQPVTTREKLEQAMLKPLRGSQVACDVGLFDESERRQLDMLDLM